VGLESFCPTWNKATNRKEEKKTITHPTPIEVTKMRNSADHEQRASAENRDFCEKLTRLLNI